MQNCFDKGFAVFYAKLPLSVQKQADRAFEHFAANTRYPSIAFKCVNKQTQQYSLRIGKGYRAVGHLYDDTMKWEWVGGHDEYERRID